MEALEWRSTLASQLENWKRMAATATGVLSSVGMAIGGTGAILAGGTIALVKGAVQGAIAAGPSSSSASPAATPQPSTERRKDRRPRSADARAQSQYVRTENPLDHCSKCHDGAKTNHLYRGNCIG